MKTEEDYNKTTIDILNEFAENTGRTFEYTEKAYPGVRGYSIALHRRTVYIPNNFDETSYYVCFQDPKYLGELNLYCGVFFPISFPESVEFRLRIRTIFDKFNSSLKKKSLLVGLKRFDSKVVISGNNKEAVQRIFQNSNVHKLVFDTLKLKGAFKITLNKPKFNFVPGLKGKSYFGFYTKQGWRTETDEIESMFKLIEAFREVL